MKSLILSFFVLLLSLPVLSKEVNKRIGLGNLDLKEGHYLPKNEKNALEKEFQKKLLEAAVKVKNRIEVSLHKDGLNMKNEKFSKANLSFEAQLLTPKKNLKE